MKTNSLLFTLGSVLLVALSSCDKDNSAQQATPQAALDEASRRELAATRQALEQQAITLEERSDRLEQKLAELQRSLKEKGDAETRNYIEQIQRDNDDLRKRADEYRQKSYQIDDQLVAAEPWPAQPAEADYTPFYEDLNSYGQWYDVDGYGYAWQPKQAQQTSWRPYLDGSWAWTNYGWTWQTAEPFGWACYHYGRWIRLARYGWVWIPGREWAPAWVSWRTGDDCVGWAPLPPEPRGNRSNRIDRNCDVQYNLSPASYCFVPSNQFNRRSYRNAMLSMDQVTQRFSNTRNVTQIVRSPGAERPIFTHRGGPDRRWMERETGEQIRQARVEKIDEGERPRGNRNGPARPSTPDDPGIVRFVQLSDRRPGNDSDMRPPRAERVNDAAPVDNWEGMNPANRKQFQAQISRQAREAAEPMPQPSTRPVAEIGQTPPRVPTGPAASDLPIRNVTGEIGRVPAPETDPLRAPPATAVVPPTSPMTGVPIPVSEPQSVQPTAPIGGLPDRRSGIVRDRGMDSRDGRGPGSETDAQRFKDRVRDRNNAGKTAPTEPTSAAGLDKEPATTTMSVPAADNPTTPPGNRPGSPLEANPPGTPPAEPRVAPAPTIPAAEPPASMPPAGGLVPPPSSAREGNNGRGGRDGEDSPSRPQRGEGTSRAPAGENPSAPSDRDVPERGGRQRSPSDAAPSNEERPNRQQQPTPTTPIQEQSGMKQRGEEKDRMAQQQALKQQRDDEIAARKLAEDQAQAKAQQETMKQQEQEAAIRKQAEEQARAQQDAAMRQQQEEASRKLAEDAARQQQQEAMQQQQQEEARRQRDEAMKQQEEARQREQAMQQQEARRQAEEQARREREEAMRQQQEERRQREEAMQQQQQEARRQAEEQARREREEAMRQQQEERRQREEAMQQQQQEARRQAEEQARREREEAMRQQQEEQARRQQEEQAKRQEDARRQAEEAARQQQQQQ